MTDEQRERHRAEIAAEADYYAERARAHRHQIPECTFVLRPLEPPAARRRRRAVERYRAERDKLPEHLVPPRRLQPQPPKEGSDSQLSPGAYREVMAQRKRKQTIKEEYGSQKEYNAKRIMSKTRGKLRDQEKKRLEGLTRGIDFDFFKGKHERDPSDEWQMKNVRGPLPTPTGLGCMTPPAPDSPDTPLSESTVRPARQAGGSPQTPSTPSTVRPIGKEASPPQTPSTPSTVRWVGRDSPAKTPPKPTEKRMPGVFTAPPKFSSPWTEGGGKAPASTPATPTPALPPAVQKWYHRVTKSKTPSPPKEKSAKGKTNSSQTPPLPSPAPSRPVKKQEPPKPVRKQEPPQREQQREPSQPEQQPARRKKRTKKEKELDKIQSYWDRNIRIPLSPLPGAHCISNAQFNTPTRRWMRTTPTPSPPSTPATPLTPVAPPPVAPSPQRAPCGRYERRAGPLGVQPDVELPEDYEPNPAPYPKRLTCFQWRRLIRRKPNVPVRNPVYGRELMLPEERIECERKFPVKHPPFRSWRGCLWLTFDCLTCSMMRVEGKKKRTTEI